MFLLSIERSRMIYLGWLSALFLGICALPQVLHSIKHKSAEGISTAFIWLWFLGEVFGLMYVFPTKDLPLITNYSMNCIFTGIILYYKLTIK